MVPQIRCVLRSSTVRTQERDERMNRDRLFRSGPSLVELAVRRRIDVFFPTRVPTVKWCTVGCRFGPSHYFFVFYVITTYILCYNNNYYIIIFIIIIYVPTTTGPRHFQSFGETFRKFNRRSTGATRYHCILYYYFDSLEQRVRRGYLTSHVAIYSSCFVLEQAYKLQKIEAMVCPEL